MNQAASLNLSLDHSAFTLTPKIQAISGHFLKALGLSYFQYLRCFADGSFGLLTNNTSLMELFNYVGKMPAVYSSFREEHQNQHSYWFLWDEELPAVPVQMVREKCNVRCGITLVKRYKNHYDMLAVALSHDEIQTGFYLNKLKLIEQFFCQFEKDNKDLIHIMNKNPIRLSKINHDANAPYLCLKNKKIEVLGKHGATYLTAQELACLRLMHHGDSYKEIAQILNISHRTVETYLQRVKQRTGFSQHKELDQLLFGCF